MTTKAIFHGSLSKRFGREHQFNAPTVFLMMQGLALQLGDKFAECVKAGKWHIVLGSSKNASYLKDASNAIEPEQVHQQLGQTKEVHFYPVIEGKSNVARIVIGTVLIVADMLLFHTGWLTQIGASFVVGGVVGMLASKPSSNLNESTSSPSYFLNSKQNVTQQGGPVPVVFGRVKRAGSVVISQGTTAAKVLPDPFVLKSAMGLPATYLSGAHTAYSCVGIVNVLCNGYWAVGNAANINLAGTWVTNPADIGGAAYEVQFITSQTSFTGTGTPPPVGTTDWASLKSDVSLVVDGSAMQEGDNAQIAVTVNIRKIGTTTPVCTGTTSIRLSWAEVSRGS